MEPRMPAPERRSEQLPDANSQNFEGLPLPPSPETGGVQSPERVEQRGEAVAPVETNHAPVQSTAVPTLPPVVADDQSATPVTDDNPVVAADEDLIEKEWVDKAKKIIASTKDDPFRREQEVSKLQADYLRKRYGKEISASQ